MTNVRYEADARRLRLEGTCRDPDLDTVHAALTTFGQLAGDNLTVDLCAVTELGGEVARLLVQTARRAKSEGRKVTLLRKLDTPPDHALKRAADELEDSGSPEK